MVTFFSIRHEDVTLTFEVNINLKSLNDVMCRVFDKECTLFQKLMRGFESTVLRFARHDLIGSFFMVSKKFLVIHAVSFERFQGKFDACFIFLCQLFLNRSHSSVSQTKACNCTHISALHFHFHLLQSPGMALISI